MKKIGKKKILGIALLTSLSIFAGTTANNITRTAPTTNNTVNDECRPPHKLQKDSNGNLVDENGNIIKGLYAAGETTGGIHGNNRLGSVSITDITVFGIIAGTNAAKNK